MEKRWKGMKPLSSIKIKYIELIKKLECVIEIVGKAWMNSSWIGLRWKFRLKDGWKMLVNQKKSIQLQDTSEWPSWFAYMILGNLTNKGKNQNNMCFYLNIWVRSFCVTVLNRRSKIMFEKSKTFWHLRKFSQQVGGTFFWGVPFFGSPKSYVLCFILSRTLVPGSQGLKTAVLEAWWSEVHSTFSYLTLRDFSSRHFCIRIS